MMKRLIIFFVVVVFTLSSEGQVNKEVILSAVGSKTNGGVSISWTLGGILMSTIAPGTPTIIQGSQMKSIVTDIEAKLHLSIKPKVYPNPFTNHIIIQFNGSLEGAATVTVFDSQGRLVMSEMIESGLSEKNFLMHNLPAGIFYLKFTKGEIENVYKIVKL